MGIDGCFWRHKFDLKGEQSAGSTHNNVIKFITDHEDDTIPEKLFMFW